MKTLPGQVPEFVVFSVSTFTSENMVRIWTSIITHGCEQDNSDHDGAEEALCWCSNLCSDF